MSRSKVNKWQFFSWVKSVHRSMINIIGLKILANLMGLLCSKELFEKCLTSLSKQKVYRISLFHIQTSKPFFSYHYPWVILFDLQAVYPQWLECFFYWASYLLLLYLRVRSTGQYSPRRDSSKLTWRWLFTRVPLLHCGPRLWRWLLYETFYI